MRTRPLTVLAAVAAVTLVLAGCDEALVEQQSLGKPSAKPVHSEPVGQYPAQPETVQLLLDTMPLHGPPEALAGTVFGGLPARIQQAIDMAAGVGATLSVAVLDRKTHELVSNGNTQIIGTASVAKLFIADDLLLAESQGRATLSPDDRQALDVM